VVLGRIFLLTTNWPIWPMALAGVLLAEAMLWLYELERRIVPRRAGLILTGLRLTLLALVILMLLQPVIASAWSETTRRTLAVLVDESVSMRISDGKNLAPHELLRLAESFAVPAAHRPWRLDENAAVLRTIRGEVLGELAWMDRLAEALGKSSTKAVATQLSNRRSALHEKITAWSDAVAGQIKTVETLLRDTPGLSEPLRAALLDAKAQMSRRVRSGLLAAAGWTHDENAAALDGNFNRLRTALRQASAGLEGACPALERTSVEMDESPYKQLSPADRYAVDAVGGLTRLELAKAVLVHNGSDNKSILEHLTEQYDVKVYTFASDLTEAVPSGWADPIALVSKRTESGPAEPPTTAGPSGQDADDRNKRTDLAGALRKVLSEIGIDNPADRQEGIAGVLVLTDGQDNSKSDAGPSARALGGAGAAFCAVAIGADKPPPDAAVVSIEAPETVCLADKMFINAELKLDGLKGKTVCVKLMRGSEQVDSRNIRIGRDVFRTHIQLGDEPKTTGLHMYRIEIDHCEGEVFTDNNSYSLALSVTDDKTKVLMVDSRPRWEFRYLKNLFTGRDKTVRLQYVLTDPDRFSGQSPRDIIPASVNRPSGDSEATALPEDQAEWMKFDVIIIGDVPAREFSVHDVRNIRRFVTDRGGTVIFVSGANFMPKNFADTELAELIPLRLTGQDKSARIPTGGFRIALTPVGTEHVISRQDVEPEKSLKVWKSFPPIFWRSSYTQASPAGTVLACAIDSDAPAWLTGTPSDEGPASNPQSLLKRREKYYRNNALITTASHGLGKVMILGFDRTWRMRYRTGDVHHHKFWGQVIRWATAGKLPAGTRLVKLGTDKTRYRPRSRPIVRARIVREDFSPVITNQLAVKVFRRNKSIARFAMKYVKDSPGMYTAQLDELPAGAYRLELAGPVISELLAIDGAEKVSTEISVDPSSPTEQIELAANRDLLGRLAGLSHNGVVMPACRARRVLQALPAGKITRKHRRQFLLWDSWVLLVLFCTVAAAEWILRKRVGLT
ncbi:MAG: hypothetical protein SVV80_11640, partial [Planctomycetota bacterium]|nr:hypothetical protein [Planctomycetota bacterium]